MNAVSAAGLSAKEFNGQQRAERANHPTLRTPELADVERRARPRGPDGSEPRNSEAERQRHDLALERIAAAQKDDAVLQTSNLHRELYSQLETVVTGVQDMADRHAPSIPTDAVHKPFLIWADVFSSEVLVDSRIVADRSWAKVRVSAAMPERWNALSVERRLSFWFIWQSLSANHEVVDVSAYLVFSGHVDASGSSWILRQTNEGDDWTPPGIGQANVTSGLFAWTWWTQPPIRRWLGPGGYAASVVAEGGRFGRHESTLVGASDALRTWPEHRITVAPYSTLVIEVAVDIDVFVDRGSADVDFASGDWRITCPFALVRKPAP